MRYPNVELQNVGPAVTMVNCRKRQLRPHSIVNLFGGNNVLAWRQWGDKSFDRCLGPIKTTFRAYEPEGKSHPVQFTCYLQITCKATHQFCVYRWHDFALHQRFCEPRFLYFDIVKHGVKVKTKALEFGDLANEITE